MKALSLTQPWATLVAIGAKRIETRSWHTTYRGRLAIHAAKGLGSVGGHSGLIDLCLRPPFAAALLAGGKGRIVPGDDLPLGAIVATANLVLVEDSRHAEGTLRRYGAPHERAFGDYSPGRYLWVLRDVRALPEPIPARGAMGLWEWAAPAGVRP